MTIEELKELKDIVHNKSCTIEYDEEYNDTQEYEIEDKELMWALEECEELINSEIARQSVTDEDVQGAIDILHDYDVENIHDPSVGIWRDEDMAKAIPVAIQALQQMRTEPCAWCNSEYTIVDDDFCQPVLPKLIKNCFHCGRKLR
jgi:uncharacterized protein HemX